MRYFKTLLLITLSHVATTAINAQENTLSFGAKYNQIENASAIHMDFDVNKLHIGLSSNMAGSPGDYQEFEPTNESKTVKRFNSIELGYNTHLRNGLRLTVFGGVNTMADIIENHTRTKYFKNNVKTLPIAGLRASMQIRGLMLAIGFDSSTNSTISIGFKFE